MPLADPPNTWPNPPATSPVHVLAVLVGAPLLVIAIIALLVIAPSLARGPRYRPGLSWWAGPEWFGGPEQGLRAVDTNAPPALESGYGATGSASGGSTAYGSSAGSGGRHRAPVDLSTASTVAGGGASASW